MRRIMTMALLAVLLTALSAGTAHARKTPLMWVSSDGEKGVDAICWYTVKNNYYLFIPANLDLDKARIGFSDIQALSFTKLKKTVEQGESAAFLEPGEHTVTIDGKKRVLTVMRGSAGIPALYITTESGSLTAIQKSKENREPGSLVFVGPDGQVQYNGSLEHIKCRGNSSMTFAKKNFQIKLAEKADLMGMGKARKWILTGNYRDKSLLRNQIVLDIAQFMNMPYTPEHVSAELYINNEYQGLYLFSEKVEIENSRIDIFDLEKATEAMNAEPLEEYPLMGPRAAVKGQYKAYKIPSEPEDITGGYLVEFESYPVRYKQEPSAYSTLKGNILVTKSPEFASLGQMQYISGKLQAFENAIFAGDGIDKATGLHYTDIVDLDSLVHKYMIEEFAKNYDGNSSSMYFYKPSDAVSTRFFAGPAWDYDSTFGTYAQQHNAKKVLTGKGLWIASAAGGTYWWPALYRQPDFFEAVRTVWKAELKPATEIILGLAEPPQDTVLRSLDAYAESIRASAAMNDLRWPRPSRPSTVANTGNTLDKNIEFLRTFITDRFSFLSDEWE